LSSGIGWLTHVTFMKCFTEIFSLVTLPPHVPQPKLAVMGMPLVNAPALPLTCGCLTMMRLTGAISAKR